MSARTGFHVVAESAKQELLAIQVPIVKGHLQRGELTAVCIVISAIENCACLCLGKLPNGF